MQNLKQATKDKCQKELERTLNVYKKCAQAAKVDRDELQARLQQSRDKYNKLKQADQQKLDAQTAKFIALRDHFDNVTSVINDLMDARAEAQAEMAADGSPEKEDTFIKTAASTSLKEKRKPATRTRFMSPPAFFSSDGGFFKPTGTTESIPPGNPPVDGNGDGDGNGNENGDGDQGGEAMRRTVRFRRIQRRRGRRQTK